MQFFGKLSNQQINGFFPKGKGRGNIKMTPETFTYFTKRNVSEQIRSIIMKELDTSELILTDMTGCIGGDSIAFGSYFHQVNSVELCPEYYEMLVHNIGCYRYNILPTLGNSVEFIQNNVQDVIFCDPPWGGADYKKQGLLNFSMDGKPLEEIADLALMHAKMVIFKLPKNYDFERLKSGRNCKHIILQKMDLMIIT